MATASSEHLPWLSHVAAPYNAAASPTYRKKQYRDDLRCGRIDSLMNVGPKD
jgi:hypothetical protein